MGFGVCRHWFIAKPLDPIYLFIYFPPHIWRGYSAGEAHILKFIFNPCPDLFRSAE